MSDSLKSIYRRIAEIQKIRAKLDEEEHDLNIAERVLMRLEATSESSNGAARGKSERSPTQTDLIVATLKSTSDPWFDSTNIVHDIIKLIHGVDIKKSSFQPLMSQLVKNGVVVRDGFKVALAERVKGGAETNQAAE